MGADAVDVLTEAFVYSDRDVSLLPEYKSKIMEAYLKGARSGGVDLNLSGQTVRDIFALAWGFRIADLYLYHKKERRENDKARCVDILRSMLEENNV